MAYSIVQQRTHTQVETASALTTSAMATVGAGNLLIAFASYYYNVAEATLSISDTVGGEDSWTQMGTIASNSTMRMAAWYRIATGGAASVINVSSTGNHFSWGNLVVTEVSGLTATPYINHAFIGRNNPSSPFSSDVTGTLSSSPALIYGGYMEEPYHGTVTTYATLSDGTTTITDLGREIDAHARVTATTSVAMRWSDTNAASTKYLTFVSAWAESTGGPTFIPRMSLLGVG